VPVSGSESGARRAKVIVTPDVTGQRLDQAMAALMPDMSRRLARKVIAMGAVHVGKRVVRIASYMVRVDEVLSATWHPEVLVPETFVMDVVHQDEAVVVVVKPPGQLSQGSELGDTGSLIHALHRRFGPDVRLMHRLDKGASGLLVAGLSPDATAALTPQFREHTIQRRYLAVTEGVPAAGSCEVPITFEGRHARAARPGEDGQPARSDVEVVRVVGTRALVAVRLFTGRTHQIRIHLASLGAPIVGDGDYGGPPAERMCLHAAELGFVHPAGAPMAFERSPDAAFWSAAGLDP